MITRALILFLLESGFPQHDFSTVGTSGSLSIERQAEASKRSYCFVEEDTSGPASLSAANVLICLVERLVVPLSCKYLEN